MILFKKRSTRVIAGVAAGIILVAAAVMITVNSAYVFIGGEAIRKDSTEVEIDFKDMRIGRDLKRLDRLSNMDELWLKFISDDDDTEYIPQIKGVERLTIPFSKIKSTAFLNNFENIENLNFTGSTVDFEKLSNDASVESLEMWSCYVSNFDKAGECSAIKELKIFQCNLSGSGNDSICNELDSNVLSGFDYVNSVEITNMKITDISGFLKMKSLKELSIERYTLDEPPITEDQVNELRGAEINVTADNEKH